MPVCQAPRQRPPRRGGKRRPQRGGRSALPLRALRRRQGVQAGIVPQTGHDLDAWQRRIVGEYQRPHHAAQGKATSDHDQMRPGNACGFLAHEGHRLSVHSGQAVVADGVKTTSKSGRPRLLVIVAARLLETDAKPGQWSSGRRP